MQGEQGVLYTRPFRNRIFHKKVNRTNKVSLLCSIRECVQINLWKGFEYTSSCYHFIQRLLWKQKL